MKTMESELQRLNPDLFAAYSRSYTMAIQQWLPQVVPNKDSVNSLPHLLGVKNRVDELLYSAQNGVSIQFEDAELYVMLCAVLFHDIGKSIRGSLINVETRFSLNGLPESEIAGIDQKFIDTDTNTLKCEAPLLSELPIDFLTCHWEQIFHIEDGVSPIHANISKEIIENHWAEIGIVTERVARVVGGICAFHDSDLNAELSKDYYIDGFGHIRAHLLASLLLLADQLDNTFTRITPPYIKSESELAPTARFRNLIQSTRVDRFGKMACTVIDSHALEREEREQQTSQTGQPDKPEYDDALYDYICAHLHVDHLSKGSLKALHSIEYNACDNIIRLDKVRDALYVLGLPIKDWLVEYDGHLFKVSCNRENSGTTVVYHKAYKGGGKEPPNAVKILINQKDAEKSLTTICPYLFERDGYPHTTQGFKISGVHFALEPVLDLAYCERLLGGIYMLEGGIFGKPYHNYTELMNYVREDSSNLEKIRCAVSRISKLLLLRPDRDIDLYNDKDVWMLSIQPADGAHTKLKELLTYIEKKVGKADAGK